MKWLIVNRKGETESKHDASEIRLFAVFGNSLLYCSLIIDGISHFVLFLLFQYFICFSGQGRSRQAVGFSDVDNLRRVRVQYTGTSSTGRWFSKLKRFNHGLYPFKRGFRVYAPSISLHLKLGTNRIDVLNWIGSVTWLQACFSANQPVSSLF